MPKQGEAICYQDVINFLDYEHFPTAPAEPISVRVSHLCSPRTQGKRVPALLPLSCFQHDLSWMSHAPAVDASSEVSVDALLRELGLDEELCCGDDAEQPSGVVVPARTPGHPSSALPDPALIGPESCELVLRDPDVLCKPCGV